MKAKDVYFKHETAIVDDGADIGEGTKIWHFSHISAGAKIGNNCTLGQNVFVGGEARIGNYVKIQNNVSVYDKVILDNYVFCGPSMVFTNDFNPRSKYPKGRESFLTTHVCEGATIGANVTIVCGNTIGRHAFIGSGAVVTKNIPDYALVYGNPAKQHGWICECGEKLSIRNNRSTCVLCKRTFVVAKSKLKEVKK